MHSPQPTAPSPMPRARKWIWSDSPSSPTRPDALVVYDFTHQANVHTTLANYYSVVFSLIRGDTHRAPLPFELVIYIVRLAGLALPYPSKQHSGLLTWKPSPPRVICGTGLRRSPVVLVPLLKTAPLPKNVLQAISKVEIIVNFLENIQYKVGSLHGMCIIGWRYLSK